MIRSPAHPALAAALILAIPGFAQDWETVKNQRLGVGYRMPKDILKAVPLNMSSPEPHLEDRWETVEPTYGKHGSYRWDIQVLQFLNEKSTPTTGASDASAEKDPPEKEKAEELTDEQRLELMRRASLYKDFATWLAKAPENRGAAVKVDKADKQKRGDKLAFKWYEWTHASGEVVWLHLAACYPLDGREIAFVAHFPEDNRRRYYSKIQQALESMTLLDGASTTKTRRIEGEEHVQIDPELRRRLLDKALENIAGKREWDVFCTPNYIVLYAFDEAKRAETTRFAKDLAAKMEDMREQYAKLFPPHPGVEKWWSVLRICRSEAEFRTYGESPPGVIGWFSPLSKELVLYGKTQGMFSVETVAFHEGWHQYANFWFPGAELHRWFDEGLGDYFGSMKRLGRGKWKPEDSKMRKSSIKVQLNTGKTIPLSDIVTWHKDKFYGPRAADHYAQGWALVDFLLRGKDSSYFDKSWSNIFDTYVKVALETKDTDKAVQEAFKDVDWAKLEDAWQKYVKAL